MDGVEATKLIREWERINNVKNPIQIVAMTANTLQSDKELFISVGMNDYLGKPFNNAELIHVVERIHRKLKRKNIESAFIGRN
jgi:CheY-like chemotaxis protein